MSYNNKDKKTQLRKFLIFLNFVLLISLTSCKSTKKSIYSDHHFKQHLKLIQNAQNYNFNSRTLYAQNSLNHKNRIVLVQKNGQVSPIDQYEKYAYQQLNNNTYNQPTLVPRFDTRATQAQKYQKYRTAP